MAAMPDAADLVLLVHAAATLFMTGLVWFVQVVHYPLFARVGEAGYARYQAEHMRRTGWVVAPAMLTELGSGIALLWLRPAAVGAVWVWFGLALLAVVWASTALVQVPRHDRLVAGWDERAGRELVATNWLRTAAWSARALLALAMVAGVMAP
jgi:uncharacterized membrane protein